MKLKTDLCNDMPILLTVPNASCFVCMWNLVCHLKGITKTTVTDNRLLKRNLGLS